MSDKKMMFIRHTPPGMAVTVCGAEIWRAYEYSLNPVRAGLAETPEAWPWRGAGEDVIWG